MWIEWPTVHEAVTPAILQGFTGDRMGDGSRYRINNVIGVLKMGIPPAMAILIGNMRF